MKLIGYVIHLRRANERLEAAEKLLDQCMVPCSILDGIDGKSLAQEQIDQVYRRSIFRPKYPFPLGVGEIGCFLSHRKAWEELVDSDADAALIFEDDVEIKPGFSDALHLALSHAAQFGYIQFQTRSVDGDQIDANADARLFVSMVSPLRTSGQVVTRAAAQSLLRQTEVFDRPVDTFLQMHWETGIRMASVAPSGLVNACQISKNSTIAAKKSIGEKLSREVLRLRYRSSIRRLSRRYRLV